MRKICLFGVFAALMFFGGCGEKKETKTESNEISNQAANIVEEPRVIPSGWDYTKTLSEGKHTYSITLHREADSTLQVVKDVDGVEYIDNRIRVSILRDGNAWLDKTFTKEAFYDFISAKDYNKCLLHGIAFDRAEEGLLIFGVHIGSPDDDANYYFSLSIDRNALISIVRDDQQDTSGSDSQTSI